jgi:hypothetical protein
VYAPATGLHGAVEPYVDSSNESDGTALWPLVRRVRMRGPWGALAGGVVLVAGTYTRPLVGST